MLSSRLPAVVLAALSLGACVHARIGPMQQQPVASATPGLPTAPSPPIAVPAPGPAASTSEASCYPIPGRAAPPGCPLLAEGHEDAEVDEAYAIDDGVEPEDEEEALPPEEPHPYAGLSDAAFARKVRKDPAELGPMSIGFPAQGRLFNAIQMPQGPLWQVVDPSHAWGTRETVDYLTKAIERVHAQYPQSPRVVIGHISARLGGPLSPHKSHQAGRDVDVGYYHTTELRWFAHAGADNLDRARTWALVKSLLKETRIDLILIDRSIQRMLREYAIGQGEDESWLREVFDGAPGKRAMILHARGHADHIHVRFFNPVAQETGRRAAPTLLAMGLLRKPVKAAPAPTVKMLEHRVKKAETLGMIARKYGVTVQQIRAANGMLSNRIKPGQILKIPAKPAPAKPAPAVRSKQSQRPGNARSRP